MVNNVPKVNTVEIKEQFNIDTQIVAEQSISFIEKIHPAYLYNTKEEIKKLSYEDSDVLLDAFSFFRICSCSTDKVDDVYAVLNEKMNKFYTALYSLNKPVVFGIVSYKGRMDIVIGLYDQSNDTGLLDQNDDAELLKNIMEGLLDNVDLVPYKINLSSRQKSNKEVGLISGIPTIKLGEEKQKFSMAPLMKSLNGQDFTVLFISRPLSQDTISDTYKSMIQIKDKCFAVSKHNISRQQGSSYATANTDGSSNTTSHSSSDSKTSGGSGGIAFVVNFNHNSSKTKSETDSESITKNYSQTITETINKSESIASDIQNGFALELMGYADQAMDRLRQGRINGMWETVVSYSSDSETVSRIIQASITGELSKPNPTLLPQASHMFSLNSEESSGNSIIIPKIFKGEKETSPLCTAVTSEELGLMCTLPDVAVPNFELRVAKGYPLITDDTDGIEIGKVCDGKRVLNNLPFSLSETDLSRHTFVCGITGSGKTTTVKGILQKAKVPFLVIESAKKEYRNIRLNNNERPDIYTLGKPEINCLRFNPFYIQCGISPQMHIDFLKDLFNASFSFYGPMPYILEKCLQNIYKKKGWNLTLGYHPYLMNTANSVDFFDADYMKSQYKLNSHKYLFPTMQDLKHEIERYIEDEMNYEGDVAGNIKTAIKARLESLCSGSKGFMFNTHEYAEMSAMLSRNTIFELEGLADDSDKAFCVGLLVIFINEYRQIAKETVSEDKPLSHLLVIEEAHRLLKNVSTDKVSEESANPKGKAVEHFTNMIAEMRSYGQGVIVAEQIPSKLAPDVIKNTSNKILQRLVAADDQELVANTIGLPSEDAINLGSLTRGISLCHKEGMQLPVKVNIMPIEDNNVSDTDLYGTGDMIVSRFEQININMAKEVLAPYLDNFGIKTLNTILVQDYKHFENCRSAYFKRAKSLLSRNGIEFIMCEKEERIYADILYESLVQFLLNGTYSIKQLVSDKLHEGMIDLFTSKTEDKFNHVKKLLWSAYNDDPTYKGKYIVAQLVRHSTTKNTDIPGTIRNYFWMISDTEIESIRETIDWG